MIRRRILIVGSTGLLGPYLVEAAGVLGEVIGAARRNADVILDATDRKAVVQAIGKLRPDIVIHAAGMTDVDRCERNPAEAYRLNRDAVSCIVESLPPNAYLVFVSTDQVYPDSAGLHMEEEAAPVNVYGKSKLAGEEAVLRRPGSLVLRTNLFGPSRTPGRSSLSDFVIDSLSSGKEITLFEDIFFSPLHMATLGDLLIHCVRRDLTGIYNLGSRAGMSKKDFALEVAFHKGLPTRKTTIGVSSEISGRAPRPRDMRMDVTRIESAVGMRMPDLREEIARL
jgi:dTDP-4-dehydrorhamnose reductase